MVGSNLRLVIVPGDHTVVLRRYRGPSTTRPPDPQKKRVGKSLRALRWRMVRTSTASVFSTPASSMSLVAIILLPTRSFSRWSTFLSAPERGAGPALFSNVRCHPERSARKDFPTRFFCGSGGRVVEGPLYLRRTRSEHRRGGK